MVIQRGDTGELMTFVTSSVTGRRAVGNLLRHFDQMERANSNEYPVIRLKTGGFQHPDDRVGWVSTPLFAIVGRSPKGSAAKPNSSLAADLQDEVPW